MTSSPVTFQQIVARLSEAMTAEARARGVTTVAELKVMPPVQVALTPDELAVMQAVAARWEQLAGEEPGAG